MTHLSFSLQFFVLHQTEYTAVASIWKADVYNKNTNNKQKSKIDTSYNAPLCCHWYCFISSRQSGCRAYRLFNSQFAKLNVCQRRHAQRLMKILTHTRRASLHALLPCNWNAIGFLLFHAHTRRNTLVEPFSWPLMELTHWHTYALIPYAQILQKGHECICACVWVCERVYLSCCWRLFRRQRWLPSAFISVNICAIIAITPLCCNFSNC